MFKRWFSVCLAAVLLVSCLPVVPAAAAEDAATGEDLSQFVIENPWKQPSGITVNVFDYWITEKRGDPEFEKDTDPITDPSDEEMKRIEAGINKDHTLKFFNSSQTIDALGTLSQWTGDEKPKTGIVKRNLGEDGFPTLNENVSGTQTNGESLSYLFNDQAHNGKKAFTDVEGLLQVDDDGYYYYNASQKAVKSPENPGGSYASANFAVLNETDENNYHFDLYKTWGVRGKRENDESFSYEGEFFPFANPDDIFDVQDGELTLTNIHRASNQLNHFFGMHMTTRFLQQNDGKTPDGKDTIFEFSGDDDVWIFIDGILVADLGGIHDSASVKINFVNGTVKVNGEDAPSLKDSFQWAENQTTFPNNTYHKLDFFYLERGYHDSNMSMKFNLAYIPESSIEKVDQFGTGVEDATFQLSAAKEADGGGYVPDKNFPGSNNGVLATGTTDDKGHLALYDDNRAPLSLDELRRRGAGDADYLLLSETSRPDGYRPLSDIPLQLVDLGMTSEDPHHSLTALFSQDPWRTGVFSSGKVTATVYNKFHYGLKTDSDDLDSSGTEIKVTEALTNDQGTLFAVVLRRDDTSSKPHDSDGWSLVTGSAIGGWNLTKIDESGADGIGQLLGELQKTENQNNCYLFSKREDGSYKADITNLPGLLEEYYIAGKDNSETQYAVAYYYTTAKSLEDATKENTYRVKYDDFDTIFSAALHVPNIFNRLLVQKVDDNGKVIPAATSPATFALYKQDAVDESGDTVSLKEGADAYQTVKTQDYSKDSNNRINLDGAAVFGDQNKPLENGVYYLKETKAPEGYDVNDTWVKVIVDDGGVHAYAGDPGTDDGISTIVGVGSLVETMAQFASPGLDVTLRDIWATKVVGTEEDEKGLTWHTQGSDVEGTKTVALQYDPDDAPLEYKAIEGGGAENPGFISESGWTWFQVKQLYQDKTLNILADDKQDLTASNPGAPANSEDVDLTRLFSGTTTVRVENKKTSSPPVDPGDPDRGELEIKKTVNGQESYSAKPGEVVTFQITVTNTGTTALTNVLIKDQIPEGLLQENGTAWNVSDMTFEAFDLAVNGSKTVAFKAQVSDAAAGKTLINVATAKADNADPKKDDAKVTVIVPPVDPPDDDDSGGSGGSGGGDKPTPPDLNTVDHYAYIIGYPKDETVGEPVEPEGDITRAEVATIFFRMLTDEARTSYWSKENTFSDVAAADWHNNAISTLGNRAILAGYPDGSFRPDASITRAEFTKIAVSFFNETASYQPGTFPDVEADAWYADFIAAAVALGLIEGYPDGTIRPQDPITRAEACTIINRTLGRVPEKDHLLPEEVMRLWPDNLDRSQWYYAQMQEATNSHDYQWISPDGTKIEQWTKKLPDRDWAALEKEWSNPDSAPGGEVMD